MPKVVDHARRRAEITGVTAREIARVGIDGVRVRDVARAAGSTSGLVSYYFADKRELLLATFHDVTALAARRAETAIAAGASRLEAYVEGMLPTDAERMLTWRVWLAFWGAAMGDDVLSAEQRRRQDTYTRRLAEALRDEQAAGRVRAELDCDDEARRLISVIDGISVQALFAPDVWTAELQRRHVEEHLATLRPPTPVPTSPAPTRRQRPPSARKDRSA